MNTPGNDPEDELLDTSGLLCPLPVLKARKRLSSAPSGTVLRVRATDPASVIDFPHFCEQSGHQLLEQSKHNEVFEFRIRRK